VILVDSLTQRFGRRTVLNSASFQVQPGDLFGLVGPNGAGKTTLLRILATLLRPSGGTARIAGFDVLRQPDQVRRRIGYMPDTFGVYPDLTAREYLQFFGSVYGLRGRKRETVLADLLQLVGLESKANEPVEQLSRGMQQRLSLARCLIHDPEVLLLDEPASGLDPHARQEIRALLSELQRMKKAIILSSHQLSDVSLLCNKILVIDRGKTVFCGGLREFLSEHGQSGVFRLDVRAEAERAMEFLQARVDVARAVPVDGGIELTFQPNAAEPSALLRDLLRERFDVTGWRQAELTLEDVFVRMTSGAAS
jgi:ABC-2 type transport system ATP-binding protein